jgi:uncharacterized protein YecT (DUF1311 family)
MATRLSCLLCFCALLWSVAARPASFDCDKANTQIEKIICGDSALSELDDRLATAYKQLLQVSTQHQALKARQQGWLRERNACPTRDCVEDTYLRRIEEISSQLTVGEDAKAHRPYRLVPGKEEPVCAVMLKLYNADISKFGIEQYTREPFSAIHWKSLHVAGDPGARVRDIDLYNNGNKQKIVKIRNPGVGPISSAPFTEYRIYKAPSLPSGEISAQDLDRNSVSVRPLGYWFRYGDKSDALDYPEIAVPFVFNGITYVSLRDLDRESFKAATPSNGFHLIVKYLDDIEAFHDTVRRKVREKQSTPRKNLTLEDELALQAGFFKTICILEQ